MNCPPAALWQCERKLFDTYRCAFVASSTRINVKPTSSCACAPFTELAYDQASSGPHQACDHLEGQRGLFNALTVCRLGLLSLRSSCLSGPAARTARVHLAAAV